MTWKLASSLLGVAVLTASVVSVNADPKGTPNRPIAKLYTASASDAGDNYWAISLRDGTLPETGDATSHVILVDTSASQVGIHRTHSLAVVENLIQSLPADHSVTLFAIDSMTERLIDGFVAVGSEDVQAGLHKLNKRVPLGATELDAALKTAAEAIDNRQHCSIVYVGDGMSTASLLHSQELAALVGGFRDSQVVINSYVVGPQTDLQLLGILGLQTGGVVLFDHDGSESAEVFGRQLASAATAAVFYPTEQNLKIGQAQLISKRLLPIRADRETITLAKGKLPIDAKIDLDGSVNGSQHSVTFRLPVASAVNDYAVLQSLWSSSVVDEGLTLALAGEELLESAHIEFNGRVANLLEQGERAVDGNDFETAGRIAQTVSKLVPENQRAQNLIQTISNEAPILIAQNVDKFAQPEPADVIIGQEPPEPSILDQAIDRPPTDTIGEVERIRRIAGEQLQIETTRAIESAREIVRDDPAAALADLRRALNTVETAPNVDRDIQLALRRRLENEIEIVIGERESIEIANLQAQERLAQRQAEARLLERSLADEIKLQQLIERVRALMEDGRHGDDEAYEAAEETAAAAIEIEPGEGTSAAAFFVAEAAGQLRKAERMRALRADKFLETLYQVELSHVPFPDEPPILWPPAEFWAFITENRKKYANIDLLSESPAERRIRSELDSPTELEFAAFEPPLREALEYIAGAHNITIFIDEQALLDENIDLETPIRLNVSNVRLRSALRLMLRPLQLTYLIKDDVLQITTQLAVDEDPTNMQTRVYPVGDLVIPIQTVGGAGGIGGGIGGGGGVGGGGGGVGIGGGGGGGLGQFQIGPEKRQMRNVPGQKMAPAGKRVSDPELRNLLNGLGNGNETSDLGATPGQAFAQIADPIVKKKP